MEFGPWFIVRQSPENARLIRTAGEVNHSKPEWVLGQVVQAVADIRSQRDGPIKLVCFGLAFKPDIDDLRESPALKIAKTLSMLDGVKLQVVEPFISELPGDLSENCELVDTRHAQDTADIALLLVDHSEFKTLKKDDFHGSVIDTKGIWD